MTLRISTPTVYERGIGQITTLQRQLSDVQQQLSTGLKINRPSDDPVATTQILRIEQEISLTEQYQKNITFLENRLGQEEAHLDSAVEIVQRLRELTIQAADGLLTTADRNSIAIEIRQRLQQLAGIANARDSSGEYIFGGFQGETAPFAQTATGDYRYRGDDGQRFIQVSPSTRIASSDAGSRVFGNIPHNTNTVRTVENLLNSGTGVISQGSIPDQATFDAFYPDDIIVEFTGAGVFEVRNRQTGAVLNGNYNGVPAPPATAPLTGIAYTPGANLEVEGVRVQLTGAPAAGDEFLIESSDTQNLLVTVDKLARGLETFNDVPADIAQLNALLQNTIQSFDFALDNISSVRTEIGARLNSADSLRIFNEDFLGLSAESLSKLRDTDFAKAASELALLSTALQAAQQSFARITGLTLFNFIR